MRELKQGFTLAELLIVIAILGVLLGFIFVSFNPLNQLNKLYDAQRLSDLGQIKIATEAFFNDKNCMPISIPFGDKWQDSSQVYMQKVPQDPQFPSNTYSFISESNSCPQWAVTFAKLSKIPKEKECDLPSNCLPKNFTDDMACKVSGTPDCSYLASNDIVWPSISPTPSSQPNSCQFNFEIFPSKPNEMLAFLWKDDARFIIYQPTIKGTPDPTNPSRMGLYSLDVSLNKDFSGLSCDGNLNSPGDTKDCETFYNFGHGFNYDSGYVYQEFGNYAPGNTFISQNYPYSGSYVYPKYENVNDQYIGSNTTLKNITDIWSKYQCGATLYWRYSNLNDKSQVTPTHADVIKCQVPDRISRTGYSQYYSGGYKIGNQVKYSAKWDANCNGIIDPDDQYYLENMDLLYPNR